MKVVLSCKVDSVVNISLQICTDRSNNKHDTKKRSIKAISTILAEVGTDDVYFSPGSLITKENKKNPILKRKQPCRLKQ